MRPALGILLLIAVTSAPAGAGQRTYVVESGGHRIEVNLTEDIDDIAMVRAECVIPAPHERVWEVLSNYDDLEEFVPALEESRLTVGDDGRMILEQRGQAGLWFLRRGFEVTLEVTEVPKAYIGFTAVGDGSFRHFEGAWQVEARDGGTWVAHRVEIEPDFFAPRWAVRRVAGGLMEDTIDGVIARCLQAPQ